MVPTAYDAFFGGCAAVAGTLIGLLFVAISVSPHKHVGSRAPLAFQVQAGVAYTTLLNALVVALIALLPGRSLGTATVIVAIAGLGSTIGLVVLGVHDWPGYRHLWGLIVIPLLGVLYVLQLRSGIELLRDPGNPSPVHVEALLVVVLFIVAVARAWQMLGARDVRILAVVGDLVRERQAKQAQIVPGDIDEDLALLQHRAEEQPSGGC